MTKKRFLGILPLQSLHSLNFVEALPHSQRSGLRCIHILVEENPLF